MPPADPGDLRGLDDHACALAVARATGERLLQVRSQRLQSLGSRAGELDPSGARELKDAGDAAGEQTLAGLLAAARPDDAVLSEEAPDSRARLAASRVWIVDPLDGTREFAEPGRDDWAVHVALWVEGELVAGAVALPARGVAYGTADASRAPLPDRPATPTGRGGPGPPPTSGRGSGALRLAVSRSRPPLFVAELAERLGAELVPMGSAGVKAMAVLEGECDAYVHAGGQYEWDSAAPVAVARAHGLHASRLDGGPLRYNRPDPLLPDLLLARPAVAAELLAAIGALL